MTLLKARAYTNLVVLVISLFEYHFLLHRNRSWHCWVWDSYFTNWTICFIALLLQYKDCEQWAIKTWFAFCTKIWNIRYEHKLNKKGFHLNSSNINIYLILGTISQIELELQNCNLVAQGKEGHVCTKSKEKLN